MNSFKNLNPYFLISYFIFVLFISIFSFNPIYLTSGMLGALSYCFLILEKKNILKSIIFYLLIFLAVAILNPLFSHNGKTVLFFINDNRVTLEALIYGAVLAIAVVEVIFWFKCYNLIFDSEKIIFLFGKISPKTALVFSMTLRFIPNFIKTFRSVNASQKLLLKNHRLKRYLNSFSAVITQSMENAVITSDSMNARGYLLKHRTFYSRFKFTPTDLFLLIISAVLFILTVIGRTSFTYYPGFIFPDLSLLNCISYFSFLVLSFIPFIFEIKEGIIWKFSVSKI